MAGNFYIKIYEIGNKLRIHCKYYAIVALALDYNRIKSVEMLSCYFFPLQMRY